MVWTQKRGPRKPSAVSVRLRCPTVGTAPTTRPNVAHYPLGAMLFRGGATAQAFCDNEGDDRQRVPGRIPTSRDRLGANEAARNYAPLAAFVASSANRSDTIRPEEPRCPRMRLGRLKGTPIDPSRGTVPRLF